MVNAAEELAEKADPTIGVIVALKKTSGHLKALVHDSLDLAGYLPTLLHLSPHLSPPHIL